MQEEHFFHCPVCDAEISVLLDLSEPEQEYVEDCEVCCRPLRIRYGVERGRLGAFEASAS
jgi:transcription elongation factor Elf1